MGNHYLLIETPEANLVAGMRWIQGTYTKRFEDSQIWEQNMVTKLLPDNVDIEISIFIAGVTFADDLTTTRWITSADLNEIGEYSFQLIHPNSVFASTCHRIKVYENGIYLGEAYYGGVLVPDE